MVQRAMLANSVLGRRRPCAQSAASSISVRSLPHVFGKLTSCEGVGAPLAAAAIPLVSTRMDHLATSCRREA
jgi:hypothetical protein